MIPGWLIVIIVIVAPVSSCRNGLLKVFFFRYTLVGVARFGNVREWRTEIEFATILYTLIYFYIHARKKKTTFGRWLIFERHSRRCTRDTHNTRRTRYFIYIRVWWSCVVPALDAICLHVSNTNGSLWRILVGRIVTRGRYLISQWWTETERF